MLGVNPQVLTPIILGNSKRDARTQRREDMEIDYSLLPIAYSPFHASTDAIAKHGE